jgi:hypothetical protein
MVNITALKGTSTTGKALFTYIIYLCFIRGLKYSMCMLTKWPGKETILSIPSQVFVYFSHDQLFSQLGYSILWLFSWAFSGSLMASSGPHPPEETSSPCKYWFSNLWERIHVSVPGKKLQYPVSTPEDPAASIAGSALPALESSKIRMGWQEAQTMDTLMNKCVIFFNN